MTSFLIISHDLAKRNTFLKELYHERNINALDVTLITKETNDKSASIGIEDIKNVQKKLLLKPMKSETKAIVIDDAHFLTTEAQNALLKILEEPPKHTIIILSADTQEAFLPTVLSRCQVIIFKTENKKLSEKEQQEFQEIINSVSEWGIEERLKKAEVLGKDKEKALEWIEKMILTLREEVLVCHSEQYVTFIKSFQSLHTLLKTTNVNPRFAIEHTLLSLNKLNK